MNDDEHYDFCDEYHDESPCTICGGERIVESDDYFEEGADFIQCPACSGTGLLENQTIF